MGKNASSRRKKKKKFPSSSLSNFFLFKIPKKYQRKIPKKSEICNCRVRDRERNKEREI